VYANRDGEVLECGGSKAGILRLTKAEAEELVSEMWLELTKWNAEIDVTWRKAKTAGMEGDLIAALSTRRVYLAAKYCRKSEMCGYRNELVAMGHAVTSRWINQQDEQCDESDPANEDLSKWAYECIEDIDDADAVILFTGGEQSPGRNTECGYAIGTGKPVFIIGPRESVFHHLPNVVGVYGSWADFVAANTQ
jgi:hypothetical protein